MMKPRKIVVKKTKEKEIQWRHKTWLQPYLKMCSANFGIAKEKYPRVKIIVPQEGQCIIMV